MIIQEGMTIQRKLEILSDAAKYDVACTSSGVDRKGTGTGMGNSLACGICHSFSETEDVFHYLRFCLQMNVYLTVNTVLTAPLNDVVRASFTPTEVCELTMEFYRRNYIEGLFLSSGIMVVQIIRWSLFLMH